MVQLVSDGTAVSNGVLNRTTVGGMRAVPRMTHQYISATYIDINLILKSRNSPRKKMKRPW